jgi:transcriptional regulator with PAS, ATPase and Fis domain
VPENLLESELFGYEKGAFTGAHASKPGLFEVADTGTLFLDEIGEMPIGAQVKLLRAVEERKVLRVGGLKPKSIDVRILAATNRDLRKEIEAGRFRADLYYRLNGISFTIPPLRRRIDEIAPLTMHFVALAAKTLGKKTPLVAPEVLEALRKHEWPGNIRELRSIVERAVLLCRGDVIQLDDLPRDLMTKADADPVTRRMSAIPSAIDEDEIDEAAVPSVRLSPTLSRKPAAPAPAPTAQTAPPIGSQDEVLAALQRYGISAKGAALTRDLVMAALERSGGNQSAAATLLGISRRTLINRIEQFGIMRPRKRG